MTLTSQPQQGDRCLCAPIVHCGCTVAWRGHPNCPLHQAPEVQPLSRGEIARTEHMVLSVAAAKSRNQEGPNG